MRNDDDRANPRRSTRAPTRFEEDLQAIAASVRAATRPTLEKARDAVRLALQELNYLRERGGAGIN
jgi:hypothetical protein